jgi:hypothetical protein
MSRLLLVALILTVGAGCRKAKQSAPPADPNAPTGTVLGASHAVRKAVERTVTLNELNNLRLFIDTASGASGRMPTPDEIKAAAQKEDRKLHEFLADGTIVLTGTTSREGVWAYVAEAMKTNGYVVTATGIERMDAAQLKARLQQSR